MTIWFARPVLVEASLVSAQYQVEEFGVSSGPEAYLSARERNANLGLHNRQIRYVGVSTGSIEASEFDIASCAVGPRFGTPHCDALCRLFAAFWAERLHEAKECSVFIGREGYCYAVTQEGRVKLALCDADRHLRARVDKMLTPLLQSFFDQLVCEDGRPAIRRLPH
ncbi:hypothetical protein [Pelagibacterium montanilacus]|uniref:hypothetical protein n=1 Tax=Pelagibacterium montanilacus TaxID=2185280 RepID=UPI000F8EA9D4|nr:hypothetical protein [Pelagibacterium montanilacus]